MEFSKKQNERLKFVDFMLLYCGSLNRTNLRERFNIAPAAATRDLAAYKEMSSTNIVYDSTDKTYMASNSFKSVYEHSPQEALAYFFQTNQSNTLQVKCETTGLIEPIRNEILAPITRAMSQGRALTLTYSSPFSETKEREFVPHCLVDDGLRWHVRGYCRLKERFIDLVISRIMAATISNNEVIANSIEGSEADRQWNRYVNLEIIPHPNVPNKEAIENEHQMVSGCWHVEIRAALAGYFLRRWNVDSSPNHTLEGRQYHLWLKNTPALYDVENLLIAPGHSPI